MQFNWTDREKTVNMAALKVANNILRISYPCSNATNKNGGFNDLELLHAQEIKHCKFSRKFFGNGNISQNLWPTRSPDLTPPDLYL
jgi:hypothetical protein